MINRDYKKGSQHFIQPENKERELEALRENERRKFNQLLESNN